MSKRKKPIKVPNKKTTQCSIRQPDPSEQQNHQSLHAINVTAAAATTATTTKADSIDSATKYSAFKQRHRYFRHDQIVRLEGAVSGSGIVRLGWILNEKETVQSLS